MSIDLGNTPVGTPPTTPEQAQIRSAIGLGSVNNTADSAKPVSTAQQTALNLKADLASPTFTGTVSGITAAMVGLGSVNNTADSAKPVSTAQQTALNLKADQSSLGSLATLAIPGNTTTYLRGDGTWVAVSGSVNLASPGPIGNTVPSTIAATDLVVNGNTNWTIGCTFTYGDSTASAAHRTALGLGTLATVSPTGTANATTYLRGDGSWATVTGSGGGFNGTANRLIIGATTTNADGYVENTLGIFGGVNSSVIAVPAAVGTTPTNLVLNSKGGGSYIFGPAPDGLAPGGGNVRGAGVIDLQVSRTAATQVASGANAIAVGSNNTALGAQSVALGVSCTASSAQSVAIGVACTASTNTGAVAIGKQVNSTGKYSVAIGGDTYCLASGEASFASGAEGVTASGQASIAMGVSCVASGFFSRATGRGATASRYGMIAHSAQGFTTGYAQTSDFILSALTTNAVATEMYVRYYGGNGGYITVPANNILSGILTVHGINSTGTSSAFYLRQVSIKNVAGTTLVGNTAFGSDIPNGTLLTVAADGTNNRLAVSVTGITAETWRWFARFDAVELTYGT